MKLKILLVLLLLAVTVDCVHDAIKDLISNFFSRKFSNINIIKGGPDDYVVGEIISNVLAESDKKNTIYIEDLTKLKMSRKVNRKKFLVLIVAEPVELLEDIETKITTKSFSRNAFFLITLYNETEDKIATIFNLFWKMNFYNVNIMTKNNISNNVELLTFFPFTNGRFVQKINEFDKSSQTWKKKIYYPQKFKNLYKCKLIHAAASSSTMSLKNGDPGGPDYEIINLLAEILNFTVKHKLMKSTGKIFSNGSGTQILKELFDKRAQISSASLQLDRSLALSESYPFLSDPLVLIIPPGSQFSPLEKLYKTFETKVWVAIMMVFIIAIFLLKATERFMKFKSITKKGSNDLVLNLINTFFGGSILTRNLPSQHFSRFSLTIFTLYALIIRTAYVAVLFNFLRFEVKHKEVSNVDEIIENDFSFYVYESLLPRLVDFKFYDR